MAKRTVVVGILGGGTVGAAVVDILGRRQSEIAARTGITFEVRQVCVRDLGRQRSIPSDLLTDDPWQVVKNPDVDVVLELMGGIEPAKATIEVALDDAKPVVTANKELVAAHGRSLIERASANGVDLLFEAAVAGGIPLMRPLRESLAGEDIKRLVGIINGTTNYVLTRMTEAGASYDEALAEAKELGYAEADPTADVENHDAAAKAAIISNVAFGTEIVAADVYREGISSIGADDIKLAARLGYVIKPVGIVERAEDGRVGVRVHPAMLKQEHPLASVRLSFNAVFVEGDQAGELMFYGRGAGGQPTASAVIGDLIDAAHNQLAGSSGHMPEFGTAEVLPIAEQSSPFYLVLDVNDRPGVLAAVAGIFGNNDVSIRSMEQLGLGQEARLVFVTHSATEANLGATIDELRSATDVIRVGNVVRVLGDA
jgi:homoserine dehydrogenase